MIDRIEPLSPATSDKTVVLQFVKNAGLGNIMFEWAAGLGIARRLNLPMVWSWQDTGYREFGLEAFGLKKPDFLVAPVVSCKLGQGNIKIAERAVKAVRESEHKFPAVVHPFQAEECFQNVADEVRERFKLDPLPPVIPAGATPVAMQVRRGDYVGHPRLNVCTVAYFKNAMDWMRKNVRKPHFVVVSDDPAWCEQTFGRLSDVTVMPPQSAIDGLRTMVACEASVISNSTYGWWGAWLQNKGPVVVPEIWHHKPGSYGNWKPAPDRWIRVPIRSPKAPPLQPVAPFRSYPKEYERAVVYPWHADKDTWHSLRFSLRSIEANLDDKECPIVILGTRRPHWLTHGKHRVKFIECWGYPEALMRGLQIADTVMWMNDDILLLKPTGWNDCPPRHFGPVTEEFLDDFRERPNPWRTGFVQMVEAMGLPETLNFSTHTPYVFDRTKAIGVLKDFPPGGKQAFESIYFNRHPEGALPMNGERAELPPFGDARFLNHTDHRLSDELKQAIGDRFPEFAPWEIRAPFEL